MKKFLPSFVLSILHLLRQGGGRPILVGGCVRDYYCKWPLKDFDIEVFGLSFEQVEQILGSIQKCYFVGNSFGVFKVKEYPIDISLPRIDNKVGTGYRGFSVTFDPDLSFDQAARRRDLTMNSMGIDIFAPSDQQWLDPFNGRSDIDHKKLSATDPAHFAEDPLRALRVMQFSSRFDMAADESLQVLCQRFDLNELAKERILGEFDKWITSPFPKRGIDFLNQSQLIRYFPILSEIPEQMYVSLQKIKTLVGPQQHKWFCWIIVYYWLPEVHKRTFFGYFNLSKVHQKTIIESVKILQLLRTVADKVGFLKIIRPMRTTSFEDIQTLLQCLDISTFYTLKNLLQQWGGEPIPSPVVTAHHLLCKGMTPGKYFGDFLQQCLEYQDRTGEKDSQKIILGVEGERR